MFTRKFAVELKTIFGKRTGILFFSGDEEAIYGYIDILHHRNDFCGCLLQDGSITFSGKITSLIREIPFRAEGKISDGRLELILHSENSNFSLNGTELCK